MYSTEKSLIDTWGEKDVASLLNGRDGQKDLNRLIRAATLARAFVDSKLGAGGFVMPLLFTGYDVADVTIIPPMPLKLNPLLQAASDCLTVYYLALSSTLMKKEFTDCHTEWLTWLNNVKMNKDDIGYPRTEFPTGRGDVVVSSRPSLSEQYYGYPGCCGRRWY